MIHYKFVVVTIFVKFAAYRLCKVLGAEKVEIEYDYHSLSNKVEEVVQTIIDFVKRETPKGWDDRCCGN